MFQKQNWKHQFRTKFNTHFSWCLSFLSFSSAFSGLSSLIFFLFNPEQWITYVLDTMLGHFTYPYSSLKIYMLAIIASIILLKKKLWLRLCKIIGWMPAKISNSSFHSVKLCMWSVATIWRMNWSGRGGGKSSSDPL